MEAFTIEIAGLVVFFNQKKPRLFSRGLVFALPIFTASHPATIVGVHVLNFGVRDGNRWTHTTINTNSYGWGLPHRLYQKPCGF